MKLVITAILSLLVLAAGCGSDDAGTVSPATAPATTAAAGEPTQAAATAEASPTESDGAAKAEAPTETAEDPPADEAIAVAVILEPGGLGFADGDGSITRFEFSSADQDATITALTTALGEPTSQQDALECGPGALDAVNWDGLTAFFQDGAFAGWYLQEPPPGDTTTATGIGLGSKLGDVRAAYGDVTVEETTIGFEFAAGDLFGTLTADSDHDTVVTMWSGANCIAR